MSEQERERRPPSLETLITERSILVCCGSGGVGKTTIAATLALAGALAGRRACVVTIDPARRLADALSEGAIGNTPRRIDGPWPGELWAAMLDAKVTFDDLVRSHAEGPEQAERILSNRLYRNLVTALAGTQEYMATEKLYELHASGNFDLVVVDTPPARNALDFLQAPSRLEGFLNNRIFRLLLAPGRTSLRVLGGAAQLLLRTLSRVAGREIVDDTITFFRAFEGMEQGFRDRASAVTALLSAAETTFVLVAAPQREALAEAEYFATYLARERQSVGALVVNRLLPDLGDARSDSADDRAAAGKDAEAWHELVGNWRDLAAVAEAERRLVAATEEVVAPAPVVRIPLLGDDVHDLDGLATVVRHLLAGPVP